MTNQTETDYEFLCRMLADADGNLSSLEAAHGFDDEVVAAVLAEFDKTPRDLFADADRISLMREREKLLREVEIEEYRAEAARLRKTFFSDRNF